MAPADLFGNRTYGDILWFVRYSFSFFFFSCVPGNAESVLADDSIYFCPFFRAKLPVGNGKFWSEDENGMGNARSGILMMMLIARYKLNMQNTV